MIIFAFMTFKSGNDETTKVLLVVAHNVRSNGMKMEVKTVDLHSEDPLLANI